MAVKAIIFLVALVGLYDLTNAHATLVSPAGWNPSPATQVCSNFAKSNNALATWRAGDSVVVTWDVVAGDGTGDVAIYLDTRGSNFSQSTSREADLSQFVVLLAAGPSTSTGKKYFSIKVPDVTCNGTNGLCTIFARSTSNWRSCSTVAILPPCSENCTAPTVPPPTCVVATGMTFCTGINNRAVMVPYGFSPAVIDAGTYAAYESYRKNPNVFSNGESATCGKLYKEYICTLNTPPCAGSDGKAVGAVCRKMCRDAMSACQLNVSHVNLYPCDSYKLCDGETDAAVVSSPMLALVAILSLLLALLM